MGKYELINPVLGINPKYGDSIKTEFVGKNADDAASQFWTMIDKKKLFVGEILKFYFTLKGGDGKLYHFLVNEEIDDKNVGYEMENVTDEVEDKMDPNEIKQFMREVPKVKAQIKGEQSGGKKKRYKDDDSSSSSDEDDEDLDDYFNRIRKNSYKTPIYYWWYSPSIYRVKRIFTPVFVPKITPYYQLWLPLH